MRKLNTYELCQFFQQLEITQNCHITIGHFLDILEETAKSRNLRRLAETLRENSKSLSEAMTKSRAFGINSIRCVQFGEKTGSLAQVIKPFTMSLQEERKDKQATCNRRMTTTILVSFIGIALGAYLAVKKQ